MLYAYFYTEIISNQILYHIEIRLRNTLSSPPQ